MMMNFDVDLSESTEDEPTGRTYVSRDYLTRKEWDWSDLRDYVVWEIQSRWGPIPRDSLKEASIFKSFLKRWPQAKEIAKFAFETGGGEWQGRRVSVYSFMKAEDENFAAKIVERLDAPPS